MGDGWLWVISERTKEEGQVFEELVEDLVGISCLHLQNEISHHTRKQTTCLWENKGVDQLFIINCTTEKRCYFRYTDSKIPLLL